MSYRYKYKKYIQKTQLIQKGGSVYKYGTSWLKTNDGFKWLDSEDGHDWLGSNDGFEWLGTNIGRDFLSTDEGRKWLNTSTDIIYFFRSVYGKKWLKTNKGHDWLDTERGLEWISSPHGFIWLNTDDGLDWINTSDGPMEWLGTESGLKWLQSPKGKLWANSDEFLDWAYSKYSMGWFSTDDAFEWLNSEKGYKWIKDKELWLNTDDGGRWLDTQYGIDWLYNENVIKIIRVEKYISPLDNSNIQQDKYDDQSDEEKYSDELYDDEENNYDETHNDDIMYDFQDIWLLNDGYDWFNNHGKKFLDSYAGVKFLKTDKGNVWLYSADSINYINTLPKLLDTDQGHQWIYNHKEWLNTPQGNQWILSFPKWLDTNDGHHWIYNNSTWFNRNGQQWIGTLPKWLDTRNGHMWIGRNQEWLDTTIGKEWINKLPDFLDTRFGHVWINTNPLWIDTITGKRWIKKLPKWLDTNSGHNWINHNLSWVNMQDGWEWINRFPSWLGTEDGNGWISLNLDWLNTNNGKIWLSTGPGNRWRQTENGQNWLLTLDGQNWENTHYFRQINLDRSIISYFPSDPDSPHNVFLQIKSILKNTSLKNYKNIDFQISTGNLVEAGGILREVFGSIFPYYFTTYNIILFNPQKMGKYNIPTDLEPNVNISVLNQKYFNCINESRLCNPSPISSLGHFSAYICHMNSIKKLTLTAGLFLDKHLLSLLNNELHVPFIQNYCPRIRNFCNKSEQEIEYSDIKIDTFPILQSIIALLTFYNHLFDIERNIDENMEKLNEELNLLIDNKIIQNIIINSIIELNYLDDKYKTSIPEGTLQFNILINLLTNIYERVLEKRHNLFIDEYHQYGRISHEAVNWSQYLISDGYETKEELMKVLRKIVVGSEVKNKLLEILKEDFNYEQIRQLLDFWTSSKFIIDPPRGHRYTVEFSENEKIRAWTCFFNLYIPNRTKEEIKISILAVLGQSGFNGGSKFQ